MDSLKKNFQEFVNHVENIKKKNENNPPVFSNVPPAFKTFGTKIAKNLAELKTNLSFEYLNDAIKLRSNDLNDNNDQRNLSKMVNWIVSALKHIIDKVDEQGVILTVHTEALSNPDTALLVAKDTEIRKLKSEISALTDEVDETRQRSMKGNLIVSSPKLNDTNTLAIHKVTNGKKESDAEMVSRLIKLKSGVEVDPADVIACHPIGKKERNAYVIRLFSRREDSAWHLLTEGMKSGGNFNREVNVFINFQLTNKRAKLAKIVRKAKKDSKIHKYIINQNGAIKVKISDQDNYTEVNSELSFNNLIRPEVFHDAN